MICTASTPSQKQTVAGHSVSVGFQRRQLWLDPAWLFFCFCLASAALTILYALYKASLQPNLPRILVDSTSFSKLNCTSSNLTANGLVSLRVINTNANHSISYDRLLAVLFYGTVELNQPLVVARAPPFYQDGLSEAIIRFQFELVNEYVGEEVAQSIMSNAGARGSVDFVVKVKAQAELENGRKQRYRSLLNLKILCNPVTFGLSSPKDTRPLMIAPRELHT